MDSKKKRRRLLGGQENIFNKVSKDLGGTVPGPLYRYLKSLGGKDKSKGDYELWGYQRVLEFSKRITERLKDDLVVILGIDKALTTETGKTTYLMYTKVGYPNTLIKVTHEDTGYLNYHSSVGFNILT